MSVTRRRHHCACRSAIWSVESASSELLGGELADGFQQPETPTERAGFDGEHRPLDQILQQAIDVGAVEVLVGDHAAGVGDVERPGEDRQPLESICWVGASRS